MALLLRYCNRQLIVGKLRLIFPQRSVGWTFSNLAVGVELRTVAGADVNLIVVSGDRAALMRADRRHR